MLACSVVLAVVAAVLLGQPGSDTPPVAAPAAPAELHGRDPQASPNASALYRLLVQQEDAARSGRSTRTMLGEHVEVQSELYKTTYGDYQGSKPAGYYYQKPRDIAGKLPAFVEGDLGPGYGQSNWGVGNARWYDSAWPSCQKGWQYTDDMTDLLFAVWKGYPRADDGTYGTTGTTRNCDGSTTTLPDNGGGPAGVVGMSFHEPYPGSPVKGYNETLCRNSPQAKDPGWFSRVVDFRDDTDEYRSLLHDLSYLADHLQYFAAHDVPVLLRPYHEMNSVSCAQGFWWSDQKPADYRALWQITYNYLVHTRGLHNLLFEWSPLSWDGKIATDPRAYYPGSQYVDVVGVDDYSDAPSAAHGSGTWVVWTKQWYDDLAVYRKPRVMAESFYVPLSSAQPDTLRNTPWVMWTVWGSALTGDINTRNGVVNKDADVKYSYGAGHQVITGGGPKQWSTFDWRSLHVDDPSDNQGRSK